MCRQCATEAKFVILYPVVILYPIVKRLVNKGLDANAVAGTIKMLWLARLWNVR